MKEKNPKTRGKQKKVGKPRIARQREEKRGRKWSGRSGRGGGYKKKKKTKKHGGLKGGKPQGNAYIERSLGKRKEEEVAIYDQL